MRPYPPQKVSSDIDRIRAQTWNQLIECLVYAMSHPRGDGVTVLNTAADLLSAAVRGGDVPGAAVTSPGYNSYFKLTLMNTGGAYTVTVADGATGGASTAVVNGYTTYSLAPYTETVSADRLFYLKYTPPVYGSNGGLVSSGAMVISSTDDMVLPAAGVDGSFYTQLGRVLFSNGAATVVQDYTQGVAEVRWYVRCQY